MTMKRLTVLMVVAALAVMTVGTGHAEPKGGGGSATFECNIDIVFPNNSVGKLPAATNCDGGANGMAHTIFNAKKVPADPSLAPTVWLATSTFPVPKTLDNFQAYNILYQEDCGLLKGLPVIPPLATANGDAYINGTGHNASAPLGKPGSFHAGFSYTRAGGNFVAPLGEPHMHNFHVAKGHKDGKGGGAGVAFGQFLAKPPLKDCADKGVMEIVIRGFVLFHNNP